MHFLSIFMHFVSLDHVITGRKQLPFHAVLMSRVLANKKKKNRIYVSSFNGKFADSPKAIAR